MHLSKNKREALRNQFDGCCAYCGEGLPVRGWHAELIDEKYVRGGIAAVCTECRAVKGTATPEAFRAILADQVERAQRSSINFRTALRFGLVCKVKEPVQFWFERQQRSKAIIARPYTVSTYPNSPQA
ncbi:HNH endonuclease [Pantoea agglomerans]|uniref:HNH endonuclease n=1 Tax=Enterobacter agglomerans TaxID=549 RepID=UPI003208C153